MFMIPLAHKGSVCRIYKELPKSQQEKDRNPIRKMNKRLEEALQKRG